MKIHQKIAVLAFWGFAVHAGLPAKPALAADEHSAYLEQLRGVFRTVEDNYAPLRLKKKTIGLDWNALKAKTTQEVQSAQNDRDFYFDVADLFNSLQDSHVSITLPSTYALSLPMELSYVEDKFIVNYFNDTKLKNQGCELQVGDELVAINGQDPRQVQQSNPYYDKQGTPLASRSIFAKNIASVSEQDGIALAEQPQVSVQMRFARGGATQECKLSYHVTGVPLIGRAFEPRVTGSAQALVRATAPALQLASAGFPEGSLFSDSSPLPLFSGATTASAGMRRPGASELSVRRAAQGILAKLNRLFDLRTELPGQTDLAASGGDGSGDGRSNSEDTFKGISDHLGHVKPLFALPSDFNPIQAVGIQDQGQEIGIKNLFAGTFEYQGKRVGFLRIAAYDPGPAMDDLAVLAADLRWIIGELERKSDYLIIDQTDNPGGILEYSEMLVQALVGKLDPAKGIHLAVKPTQAFLTSYADEISDIESSLSGRGSVSFPGNAAAGAGDLSPLVIRLKEDYRKVHSAFESYRDLSDPISVEDDSSVLIHEMNQELDDLIAGGNLPDSVARVVSQPQVYTKPIYMLINQLDFSGGDLTPATLQDYGRATIVGVHTAGAGGTVNAFSDHMVASLDWRMTTSLMVRRDGSYVENKGVTPDIPFAFTIDDYKTGFRGTLQRLLDTIGNGTK